MCEHTGREFGRRGEPWGTPGVVFMQSRRNSRQHLPEGIYAAGFPLSVEAKVLIEAWWRYYNKFRPHGRPPAPEIASPSFPLFFGYASLHLHAAMAKEATMH